MSTQHTPGPWHVEGNAISCNQTVTDSQRLEPICALIGSQSDADARLIAAAPELLIALRDLRASVGTYAPRETNGLLHPNLIEAYDAASAAIAKAVQP